MDIGFGIELAEVVYLVRQIGLALVGAAGLWGFIFWWKTRYGAKNRTLWGALVGKMHMALFVAVAVFVGASLVVLFADPVISQAHEGISTAPPVESGANPIAPLAALGSVVALALAYTLWHEKRRRTASLVEGGAWAGFFALASATMIVDAVTLFDFLHSWHSILTLATVLIVDYLFFICHKSPSSRRVLYPFFPVMSIAIWAGLAIDFASVQLIFSEFSAFTPKFFFAQTLVGVIIINGVFLAGPINRVLRSLVTQENILPVPKRWRLWVGITGSMSVVSWLFITALDFFRDLTLGYESLLLFYIGAVFAAYIIQKHLEQIETQ